MEYIAPILGALTALSVLSTSLYNRQKARLDLQATQIESLRKGKIKMTKVDQLQEQINKSNRRLVMALVFLVVFSIALTFGAVYYISDRLQSTVEDNKALNIEQTELLKKLVEK